MDSHELRSWWIEAFHEGVWWAPWGKAISDLTAAEAAWKPAPDRHSIWELVNHMTFWHEYFVHRNTGGPPIDEIELDEKNWQRPDSISEDAWQAAQQRFVESHTSVRALLDNPNAALPPKPQLHPRYLLMHDAYHMGQVMYIRALLGKEALES